MTSSNNKRVRMHIPRPSAGGVALSKALPALRLRRGTSNFVARKEDTIINWGASSLPEHLSMAAVINDPRRVSHAVHKGRALSILSNAGVPCVEATAVMSVASTWLDEGCKVMARTTVTGNSGEGIIVMERASTDIFQAPLYTKYFAGREEYRVHVVGGKVVDIQQKRPRAGVETNYDVRSYDNGWVFCREDVVVQDTVVSASLAAVAALKLDFGAVDIKRNEVNGNVAVLEVNTAPALTGTTLDRYSVAMRELLEVVA